MYWYVGNQNGSAVVGRGWVWEYYWEFVLYAGWEYERGWEGGEIWGLEYIHEIVGIDYSFAKDLDGCECLSFGGSSQKIGNIVIIYSNWIDYSEWTRFDRTFI